MGNAESSGDGMTFGIVTPERRLTDVTVRGSAVDDGARSPREAANVPRTAWPQVKPPARSVETQVMDAFGTVTARARAFAPPGRNS